MNWGDSLAATFAAASEDGRIAGIEASAGDVALPAHFDEFQSLDSVDTRAATGVLVLEDRR